MSPKSSAGWGFFSKKKLIFTVFCNMLMIMSQKNRTKYVFIPTTTFYWFSLIIIRLKMEVREREKSKSCNRAVVVSTCFYCESHEVKNKKLGQTLHTICLEIKNKSNKENCLIEHSRKFVFFIVFQRKNNFLSLHFTRSRYV